MGKRAMRMDSAVAQSELHGANRREGDAHKSHTESSTQPSSALIETIEKQIIPRLLLAHSPEDADAVCPEGRPPPTDDEIEIFASRSVAQDLPALLTTIEDMSQAGLSTQSLLLDLVAPAAHLLGDQWLQDRRSFSDVTLGLAALQRVVAVLGREEEPPVSRAGLVVLTTLPGEQHTLAIHVLGELLRHEGWPVIVQPALSTDELTEMVSSQHVTMVGLTAKHSQLFGVLAEVAFSVRQASLNPDLKLVLGGSPELALLAPRLGASYCASGREAISLLRSPTRGHG